MIEPVKQIIEDEHYGEDSLLVGVLASACVGILDSGCYVTRGKVFASSQTGNLLYLGIDISNGDFSQILKYTFPVLLFVIGVVLGTHFQMHDKRKGWRIAPALCEIVLIIIASLLPLSWNALANPLFGLVCGMQAIAFRRIHHIPLATVYLNGNLREAVERLVKYIHLKDNDDLYRFILSVILVFVFLVSVTIGAFLSRLIGHYVTLIAAVCLSIDVYFLYRAKRSA
ncbi:YoaK family protein [Dubosiella newyorkensis]|uniref:YoaK family protein n=1 Tax=Dubosiella newyorkensis TaxID=1862672 RepID=UPI00272D4B1F|nr:YoaK family protein [Dubosiella newyorkensis]